MFNYVFVTLIILGGTSFLDHLCYFCLVFVMLSRLFIAALWSAPGKWLIFWLSFVMFNCVSVSFPCGILCRVWYLIVSIPDLCHISYFHTLLNIQKKRAKHIASSLDLDEIAFCRILTTNEDPSK